MKKKLLFSLLALMFFCHAASADFTSNYELTAPDSKMDMNFGQNDYNVIGTIKVKTADSGKNFDPLKKVVITADYSDKFMIGSATTDVQYKLYTGDETEAQEWLNGGEITLSAASIDSGAEIKLACRIVGDTSSLAAGYYFSKLKFTHKAKNPEASELVNPQTGDIVKFGKFNGSPLSWRVLDVDTGNSRALLITEDCVAKRKFATSNYEWSTSDVRAYLNGTDSGNFFTSDNFTDDEKAKILKVSIDSITVSQKSDEIIDDSGTDCVFLLGVRDANSYFEDDSERVAKFNGSACKWWLRYSTKSYARAGYVSTKGKVYSDGSLVSYSTVGVRPAIWVTFDSTEANEFETEIGFKKDTASSECVSADANDILGMSDKDIQKKYQNATNVAITGTLDSADKLAKILERINEVKMIDDLDLRSLDISEVKFYNVNILHINLESNDKIKKVESKNSFVVTLNLSGSSVQEIEVNNCEILEEVNLENCKSVNKVNFSQNGYLNKLTVKGCEELTELSCESSEVINLDIEGCTNLVKLNVKKNSLPKLNVSNSKFPNLTDFECGNQYLIRGLLAIFNFNSFLQDSYIGSSATATDTSDLANVKNIKAYDQSGRKLTVRFNAETGKTTIIGVPHKLTYDYDTGFQKNGENVLMDVTVEEGEERNGGAGDGEEYGEDSETSENSSTGGDEDSENLEDNNNGGGTSSNVQFNEITVKDILSGKGISTADFPFKGVTDIIQLTGTVEIDTELKDAVGESFDNAVVLPAQSRNQPGTYVIGSVKDALKNYTAGMKIKLFMLVSEDVEDDEDEDEAATLTLGDDSVKMKVDAEASKGAFFIGSNGTEITEVPDDENTEVIAVSPMEGEKEYTPVVTVTENENGTGGSGAGCNSIRNEEAGIRNYLILVLLALGFVPSVLKTKNK